MSGYRGKRVVDLICFTSKLGINVGFIAARLQFILK